MIIVMLNWIKKLFGFKDTQPCPETQNTATVTDSPLTNAAHMVTPVDVVPAAEPTVSVVAAEPLAAGKTPGKQEKQPPAKPRKKTQDKVPLVAGVEEAAGRGRKTPADKPGTIKTTSVKSRKK